VTTTTRRKPGARDRLVAAAERLFYADGIHAVGVDRLCAEAEVSKRSLYQHFSGKDDVIVAMLRARGEALRGLGDPGPEVDARARLLASFDDLGRQAGDPSYRGCPFVAAAVELKDGDHPGTAVARAAKRERIAWYDARARELGAHDPAALAEQLMLLFDGAHVFAVVHGEPSTALRRAVETLLDAAAES
jgi:AcrR family transcriptional regulator